MKKHELKQLIKEQILVEVKAVSHNQQIYGETIDGEIINFKLDEFNNLNCIGKNLKTLVVNDSRVKKILCSSNQLTILKLGRLPNLVKLHCYTNQLTNLDVLKCPNLEILYCYGNKLTNLNLSGCPNLKNLDCYDNDLTNLDISKCPNLERLLCKNNQLTTLDVSMCPKLNNNNLDYDKKKTKLIK
jgi:Leucine-rich repeat (LRR) protein